MGISIHIAIYAIVFGLTVALIFIDHGLSSRSLRSVILGITPFLALALVSNLLLTMNGLPIMEWAFPLICFLALCYFCRSPRVFKVGARALYASSVLLCVNFVLLTQMSTYSADPARTLRSNTSVISVKKESARTLLENKFAATDTIARGPVSNILDDPSFDSITVLSSCRQWHTWFTRLYFIQIDRKPLFYPGGPLATSTALLEL